MDVGCTLGLGEIIDLQAVGSYIRIDKDYKVMFNELSSVFMCWMYNSCPHLPDERNLTF